MVAAANPNLVVLAYGLAIVAAYFFWRLIVWVREAPTKPDPWDAEVAQQLMDPDTPEICPHCSTPQEPGAWFCEFCGRAVGPYNNLMPFVNCFSEGEVFRNGVEGRFHNRPLILVGLILFSISAYVIFAPVYLFCLARNWWRPAGGQDSSEEAGTR